MLKQKLAALIFYMLISSHAYSADILLDRVVAVVNSEVITWSELYRTMEVDASPQVKAMTENDRRRVFKNIESTFLEKLINTKLQLQEAKSMGIRVSDDELNRAIQDIKKKYSMTDDTFKASLIREGYTYEEYLKRLREQIMTNKIINSQISSKIVVTDDDVKEYIENRNDAAQFDESYRISQILFTKPEGKEDKVEIEEKADMVYKRLKDGEDFGELARQYSEDPSAGAGGELGLIKKSYLVKEFRDVISGMNPGEVSRPFWTDKGLHIIKFEGEVRAQDQKDAVEEVRKLLKDKIFTERYNVWIKELRERSFIEIRL